MSIYGPNRSRVLHHTVVKAQDHECLNPHLPYLNYSDPTTDSQRPVVCLFSFTNISKTNPVCYVRSDRFVPVKTERDPASVSHDWNSLVCQLAAGILATLVASAAALWSKHENFKVRPNSLGHRSVWGWLRVQLDRYGGRGLAPDQVNQGWWNLLAYFFALRKTTYWGCWEIHCHVCILTLFLCVSQWWYGRLFFSVWRHWKQSGDQRSRKVRKSAYA